MRKFLAVIKREYLQRVRAKMFIVTTILLPMIMSLFGVVPIVILNIDAGSPMRVAVVDETGKMYEHLNEAVISDESQQEETNDQRRRPFSNFILEPINPNQPAEQIRAELDRRLHEREIDGYLHLPPNFLATGQVEYFNRNPGDVISMRTLESALNRAVREERLEEAKVDIKTREELFKPVNVQAIKVGAAGQERDSGGSFALVFGIGFVMYLSILLYGQVILGAVIEEKETRIAEILFSSVKPFTLMMGKLVGVSLVALTQLTIWALAFSAFALYGVNLLASKGINASIPRIPFSHYIYFGLFFLLGYFI